MSISLRVDTQRAKIQIFHFLFQLRPSLESAQLSLKNLEPQRLNTWSNGKDFRMKVNHRRKILFCLFNKLETFQTTHGRPKTLSTALNWFASSTRKTRKARKINQAKVRAKRRHLKSARETTTHQDRKKMIPMTPIMELRKSIVPVVSMRWAKSSTRVLIAKESGNFSSCGKDLDRKV